MHPSLLSASAGCTAWRAIRFNLAPLSRDFLEELSALTVFVVGILLDLIMACSFEMALLPSRMHASAVREVEQIHSNLLAKIRRRQPSNDQV
jgi:hypothetical protein